MTSRRPPTDPPAPGTLAGATLPPGVGEGDDPSPVGLLPGGTEVHLDRLRRRIAAIEIQLASAAAGAALLDVRRDAASAALASFRALPRPGADDLRGDLHAAIDPLAALLARPLPRPAARRLAYARQLAESSADLQGELVTIFARRRQPMPRAVLLSLRRFERALDELRVELDVAQAVDRLLGGRRGRERARVAHELAAQVARLTAQLDESRRRLAEDRERSAVQWRERDAELRARVDEIGDALARLLG